MLARRSGWQSVLGWSSAQLGYKFWCFNVEFAIFKWQFFTYLNHNMLIEFASRYKALIGCEKYSRRINSTQQQEAGRARTFTAREIKTKERSLNDIKMPRKVQRRRRKTFEATILNESAERFKSTTCWLVLLLLQLSFVEATKRSATINSEQGKFMALLNNFSDLT